MQHGAHLVGRQIQIALPVVPDHKTMAIAMAGYGSFEFFDGCCGSLELYDMIPFFPEMPRWRNW